MNPTLKFIVTYRRPFLWLLSAVLLSTLGLGVFAGESESPSGLRPIDRFEYQGSVVRDHWNARRTSSGRIIGQGAHGLVELVGGRWVPAGSDADFTWNGLATGSNDRIWAGANGEIGFYEPDLTGVFHYHSLTGLLPETERGLEGWSVIFTDSSGRGVFIGAGCVVRTDGKSAEIWHLPFVRRLYGWVEAGRIFISGADARIFIMDDEGPREVARPAGLSVSHIGWAERLDQSDWIVFTENGLISGALGSNERFEGINRWLQKSAPTEFVRLADGRLAIGTFLNGLFIVDTETGTFEHVDEHAGLLSAGVIRIFRGEGDWLWAATLRGLNRVSTSRAISFLPNEGGLDGAMLRFADVLGDSAFVITQGGTYEFPTFGMENEPRKVSDNWFIAQTKFGSKYLAATLFGVSEFDRYSRRKVIPEENDVTAILAAKSSPNMAYYATEGQLRALREHDGQYEVLATETMGAKIESIVEDRAGDIWVAAGSEVRTLSFAPTEERFIERQIFRIADGPSTATAVTKLFGIGDEVFLIRGGSLSAHDRVGSFKPVPLLQGAEVLDVTTAGTDESWALVRPKGHDAESPRLVRLTVAGGVLKAEELGTEGLQSAGQLRNVHMVDTASNQAEVWIGTDKGIIRMRPELAKFAVQSPLLNVSMSRIEEGVTHSIPLDDIELPNGHGPVSFAWSAPGKVPVEMFVETRILGADGRWQAAADRSTREFSGLGDGSYEFQVRTVDALGRPGQIASHAFAVLPPWYRTTGAISGFCAAAVLVTGIGWQLRMRVARRRAEELEGLVEDRTRELERVNAEKTRFIARMNHEIRNPLNGLLGAIGILEQYSHRGREGRMVHILRACADHLGAVVEDVLDFSSIEGGRIVVQDRAVSIAAMLEAVPRMLHAESERTGTEIITTVAPEVPAVVIADPDRIRQILMNFVGNALKYAPGEPVHIEVTAASQDGAQSLRFAVRDHGPGISEAEKQILFSMFERGKGATGRNARGMGIGLATCRLLARRMGGEVGVISGLGEGSEFFLRLPLRVESGAIPLPETQPQTELFKIACLIVEDQEFNRVILKDMLDRFGCRVDEAPDAESALRLAAMNRYDVVFTDLELPDAAPGEILKMLQNQQSAANTPVPALVVTTAYATENVRQTCLDAGAAAFLGKPLSPSKVLAVLREIDSARRPAPAVVAPTQEPVAETENMLVAQLARIRGSSVESVASEIAGNIADEVRLLRDSVSSENSRECAHHAHRLLSLSALAITPELAGVAAGIQHDAHEGRLPGDDRLAALDAAMIAAKEKLGAIKSGAAAGGQSRAPGRSEPTASSHSD